MARAHPVVDAADICWACLVRECFRRAAGRAAHAAAKARSLAMRSGGLTAMTVLGGLACVLGGCGGKVHKSVNSFTLQPYEQLNLAVAGTDAELLVENRGGGQVAMRVPTDETAIEPSEAYTVSIDGAVIVELFNASRVPTEVRYVGSGRRPVEINPLR
jgi:hypothetical protein